MILYHYTCDHRYPSIMRERMLRTNPQIQLPGAPRLVWLTDLDKPERVGLGLTSYSLACDRTTYRIAIHTSLEEVWRWVDWVRIIGLSTEQRRSLELPGTLPMHWYLSTEDIPLPMNVTPPEASSPQTRMPRTPRRGTGGVAQPSGGASAVGMQARRPATTGGTT